MTVSYCPRSTVSYGELRAVTRETLRREKTSASCVVVPACGVVFARRRRLAYLLWSVGQKYFFIIKCQMNTSAEAIRRLHFMYIFFFKRQKDTSEARGTLTNDETRTRLTAPGSRKRSIAEGGAEWLM